MNRFASSIAALFLATALAACAGTPVRPDPRGDDDSVPRRGQRLDEVLAVIQAPIAARVHRTVSRVEVYGTWIEPWKRLDAREQRKLEGQDLAVLTEAWCRLEFDGETYEGHVVSWYLLARNRLDAMDHYGFGERCAMHNVYRPARGDDRVAAENTIAARRARVDLAPPSAFELYERGVSLVEAGRVDEARSLLLQADEAAPGSTSFARERLLEALRR